MKKRLFKAALAAALSASLLCGCFDHTQKKPIPLDRGSSVSAASDMQNGSSYRSSDTSQIVQPEQAPSSSSAGLNVPSDPITGSSSESHNESEEVWAPLDEPEISSSSVPRSSVSSVPKSSSSSVPKSSSSSQPPISSSSTTRSDSEPIEQPIIIPSAGGSLLNDYTLKWAYNQLTEKQKQAYIRLYSSAYNVTEGCDISDLGLTPKDIEVTYWAFDYDNPQFLELGSGCKYGYVEWRGKTTYVEINIDYGRTPGEVPQSEFDRITKNVLANAQTMSSDYEKLKYVHDWIVNNTVYLYANTDYESEADGPIVYGKAICEGYSKAFMYFAQSMGFECVCVRGYANVDHMWNMVKLYGQWYHVDVTWDDPVMSDGSQMLRHSYFLLSDSEIRRDHSINSPFALPSAPYSYVQ